MAYAEPEVTCPGGSLPFTCQGRASREATTHKNRLQVSRNGQAPHRTPTSPSLSQAGAGRGARDEARAEGLLRCPHPCPRPPAAASRAWGSPVNNKPLCPIVRSPSQACGAKRLGGGGEGSIFRGEEGSCQAFSTHSQNTGSSGRDLESKQLTHTHHSQSTQGVKNPTFLNKLETLTPQKDPPTTAFPGASPSTAAFKIFTLLSSSACRLQNRPGEVGVRSCDHPLSCPPPHPPLQRQ